MAATRRRELMVRWCVWALGVPLVTAAFWLGSPGIAVLAAVVGVVAVTEFSGLLQLGPVDRAVLGAAIVGLVLTAWLAPGEVLRVAAAGALAIAGGAVALGRRGARTPPPGGRPAGARVAGHPGRPRIVRRPRSRPVRVRVDRRHRRVRGGPPSRRPPALPLSPAKRWSGTLAGAAAGLLALAVLSSLTWQTAVAVAVGGPARGICWSRWSSGASAPRTPAGGCPAPAASSTGSTPSSSLWRCCWCLGEPRGNGFLRGKRHCPQLPRRGHPCDDQAPPSPAGAELFGEAPGEGSAGQAGAFG